MFRSAMTLDARQRIRTSLAAGVVLASLGVTFLADSRVGVGIVTFVLFALGLCWALAPREVFVGSGELRIERRAWAPLRVPLASVVSASAIDSLGGGLIRELGVGGFFGSYGRFRSNTLGRFRLYATRSGHAVLVTLAGCALPIVVTPDDVAGAIASIARR